MPRGTRRQGSGGYSGQQIPESFTPCPVRTLLKNLRDDEEIKAYKLGKKRWSYNQCAVTICNSDTMQQLQVQDCMQYGPPALSSKEQESGVSYQVRLEAGMRVRVNVFAVYDSPRENTDEQGNVQYVWPCITREACPKTHCEGPVLRTIQRFGKLGRRSGANANGGEGAMKNAKFMFISVDEAGSHVGVRHFRMVMGMYTVGDNQLISSTISPPIRVLANNDVPSGAAYIPFTFMAPSSWDGWRMDMHPRLPDSIRSSSGWDPEFNRSLSYRSSDRRSAASTQVKPEPEYSAPIGDILKQHAADFSMDSDLGATRLNSAISHHGYSINAATGPSRLMPDNPSGLHPDEETICYQDPLSMQSCPPMYGMSLNPSAGSYSPVLSSLSANDIYSGSPSMPPLAFGPFHLRFPPMPTNMANPFQDTSVAELGWYDPDLLDQGVTLDLQHLEPQP